MVFISMNNEVLTAFCSGSGLVLSNPYKVIVYSRNPLSTKIWKCYTHLAMMCQVYRIVEKLVSITLKYKFISCCIRQHSYKTYKRKILMNSSPSKCNWSNRCPELLFLISFRWLDFYTTRFFLNSCLSFIIYICWILVRFRSVLQQCVDVGGPLGSSFPFRWLQ